MKLHAIYRAVAGDNDKPRPPWYSKRLTLMSFLRAWEACPARGELVFLAGDGVGEELLGPVRAAGGVIEPLPAPTHRSVERALAVPHERGWPADDLVQHVEDDYLFKPTALSALVDAAAARPDIDYFALYGTTHGRQANGDRFERERRDPPPRRPPAPLELSSGTWVPGVSHNATVAVRMPAARRDLRLQQIAPRAGPWWDHAVCLAYQGRFPYLVTREEAVVPMSWASARDRGALASLRLVARRAEICVHALAHRRRPHRLLTAWPPLIAHLELPYLGEGTDWDEVAAETVAASGDRGARAS